MKKTKTTNRTILNKFKELVKKYKLESLRNKYPDAPADYDWEKDEEGFLLPPVDPHLGCYSYPMCDEAPQGCRVLQGDEVEPYGWRD